MEHLPLWPSSFGGLTMKHLADGGTLSSDLLPYYRVEKILGGRFGASAPSRGKKPAQQWGKITNTCTYTEIGRDAYPPN